MVQTHVLLALPFKLSVEAGGSGEGLEGANTGAAVQQHKRRMAQRVMGRVAISAVWPSFVPSDPQ